LLILVLLLATEQRGRPFAGRTFWLYMLLYAVSRYGIEIFRGDSRGMVGIFSTSQFISMLLAPLAIVMIVSLYRKYRFAAAAEGRIRPSAPHRR
jgi:phosphatidylglycerol:prolipoprotein diacylglycerol transferase